MAYPIKYIENNLVFNHDGECFAYYELLPYNYSFLNPEQKYQVHDSFRQLIAQNRDGKIHALQISTESSIRAAQERSKQEVTGKLKNVACAKIDAQTEALISMIGENQVDYRFFIGFKLLVNEQEVTMKQFRREAKTAVSDFLHEVNHKLMGDFVSMSNEEIWRFQKMEKLLESKISRRFKVRRLDKDDFGYLIEHLYGQTGTAYEDYEYYLPKKRFQEETLVKYYDLIKPTRCLIEENQRYLKIEQEDGTVYAAYFTINSIVGELDFPSSEIFYYQQQQFTFPIDTWEKCELSIQQSLNCFVEHGVNLPIKEYAFTILLANAKNPYIILNDGYCGDGGIPGYIFSWLLPNEYTLSHLHVALAHETNHNVRFQFIKWKNDITLGEMIVNEGLAENFATFLYGEDKAGPWVTKTDIETLNEYIKPIIRDGLNVQGLENLNAYLYGDEMAALQNYPQVGLPYCSGYACGYHLIKHYLQKTGKNIVEATLLPAKEILNATEDFWNE